MSILRILVLVFLTTSSFAQTNLKKAVVHANLISAEDLKKHLTIIAGPEMEGRETATEGQRKAAAYIEDVMKQNGLLPANNGSYQMYFPVYRDSVVSASITINNQPLIWKTDFNAPAANFNAEQTFGELVLVNLDDSAWKQNKIDVTGKLVMFGLKSSRADHNDRAITATVGTIMKKGAAAALVIDSSFEAIPDKGNMAHIKMPARQYINYYRITPKTANLLMANGNDTSRKPGKTYQVDITLNYREQQLQLQSSNVVGYLEGTTKKDEFLVISAHHDHIGRNDSLIFYGADDDGSGTVSLLELMEAFSKAKAAGQGPYRSVLFLSVSGEEKGLWGSEYYTKNPIFPLDKTTANLNIDMIGRLDSAHIKSKKPDYIYVVGDHKLSSDLPVIVKAANVKTMLELNAKYNDAKDPERIYSRSDHYNFAKRGVPVIFFFSGLHPDYHKATDTVDKINFELMEKRAKLVFYTAWEMANRKEMLVRDKKLKD
ncbi:MAG: M28 family peptidase [Bacteroidota bacterium]